MSGKNYRHVSAWLLVGVVTLIVLLLVWLTVAVILGDTDVAAFIVPFV